MLIKKTRKLFLNAFDEEINANKLSDPVNWKIERVI